MKKSYIFYADRIVSVKHPFFEDDFVAGHSKAIKEAEEDNYLSVYYEVCRNNSLLVRLIEFIASRSPGNPVNIIDVGVFMGSFSNAMSIACRHLGVKPVIHAFEVNPRLISSIIDNLRLYETEAFLHWSGVGGFTGTMEFVASPGAAIGGSLTNPDCRKYGDYFSCQVDVRSLKSILHSQESAPKLIKIDIEGFEVSAFSSIADDPEGLANIFIVEYSPNQATQEVAPNLSYSQFLLNTFFVYNIGNWGWFKKAIPIRSANELEQIELGNSGSNTDIVLIPKDFSLDLASI
ncbi:MAG: FkbM family methyltransferase [Synechococcaceae cyanobacterium]|jgi:FkbM family methyltransferase